MYPVTPTLSVEAAQERFNCVLDAGVTVRFAGAEGGNVSGGGAEVRALQPFITRTRHRVEKTA
jgi:hypothetical protein